MTLEPLGNSHFHHQVTSIPEFYHYALQIHHVVKLQPRTILEIGVGMRTVSDWLCRRGYYVKTFDRDPGLKPDYLGDLRQPLPIQEHFDVALASEVFEHLKFHWLDTVLENIRRVLKPGGHLVVSLPYTTLRFWPKRDRHGVPIPLYGGIWGGRIMTGIPYYWLQILMTGVRAGVRLLAKLFQWRRYTFRQCFALVSPHPNPPEDRFDQHHWDLGFLPTTRKAVRAVFTRHFSLIEEAADIYANCVFFILRNDRAD